MTPTDRAALPGDSPAHELVLDGYAAGAQAAALEAVRAERRTRPQRCLGAWTTEYGVLNRLLTLWEGPQAAISPLADHEQAQDWLDMGRMSRRLVPRRAVREDLLAAPVLELRMYAAHPGQCEPFVQALVAALPYRERYSPCAGVWTTRERGVDVAVHLWAYDSVQARMAARDAAMGDADWAAYRATIRPLLRALQASMLTPVAL